MNENHSEIRNTAAKLAWALSREIKVINARNSVFLADKISLIGEAVEYLLSVVCDDWSQINGMTNEIHNLGLSSIICEFEKDNVSNLWHNFIKIVADEEGCDIPNKKHIPLPTVSKDLFITIGLDLGYLGRHKKILGESKWVVVD